MGRLQGVALGDKGAIEDSGYKVLGQVCYFLFVFTLLLQVGGYVDFVL